MQTWQTAILTIMSICILLGYMMYKSDDNSGYLGNSLGVVGFFLLVMLGIIISIVVVITKFLL